MNQSIGWLFLFFSFFTVSFGVIGNVMLRRRNKYEQRLRKFLPHTFSGIEEESQKQKKINVRRFFAALGRPFKKASRNTKWERRLAESAIPLKSEEFFALRVIAAILAILVTLLLGYTGVWLIVSMIIGYVLPLFYLRWSRRKRLERCASQLAPALGTMASAMRSGFSFIQAMQLIGREVPDPIGPEFERTVREINLGISMEEAFTNLLRRLPNEDLEIVASALLIQRSTGGNLVELLETMEETVRVRIRIKDELHSLTAQGRLSGWVITFIPVVLFFVLNWMDPEFTRPMLEHPLGWALMGFCVMSTLIGLFVMRKLIDIKV